MKKSLEEMSLEELWELFPIFLTEHKAEWKEFYNDEKRFLEGILPMEKVFRISHIGSTAIDKIWAKPIIDIMVETVDRSYFSDIKKILLENGYLCMNEDAERITFNKGYTESGFAERVYHLHLRFAGDNDELYFRDYLNEHLKEAKEYEELKLSLWKKFEHNRDAYTEAKTDIVKRYTKKAKNEYMYKYDIEIETDRLRIIPLTGRQIELWVNNINKLEKELNVEYKAEPMTGIFRSIVEGQVKITQENEVNFIWHSFCFIVRKSDNVVVGSIDFKDIPDEKGEVEVGYGLGKEFEHNGYMTEAVKAYCAWAKAQEGVKHVIAETYIDGYASQNILKRCGFYQYEEAETKWWRLD